MNNISKTTKINFKYGCMNSGKSLDLIRIAYNYHEHGIKTLVIKPEIDTRKPGYIHSRTGLELKAQEIPSDDLETLDSVISSIYTDQKVILVEEANFLSEKTIDYLVDFAYKNNLHTLMFFGLKVNFRGELFPGTKRIIERADKIEEATSICWCGKKARQNARIINGKVVKEGPTIVVDSPENMVQYVTLCNFHYHCGQWKEEL